jgi:PAS domain S-box-containing protein
MTSTAGSDPVARVDDVLITSELANRPSRTPDYEIESQSLGLLAQEMATNPGGVLQKCAELVMELCHADSAGISILEPGGTSGMLRWQAAAGAFAPNLHGTMPREASPCGTVMERNCVLLFNKAERFFPALQGVEPRIYENLLAPWHVKGKAVGTIWAIKHTADGRFDAEDARVLQSLARFAAAAFQTISALDEATAERSAARKSEERLRNVLDGMDEGFCLMDRELRIITQNKAAIAMDGRPLKEIEGRTHNEVYPNTAPEVIALFGQAIAENKSVSTEHHYGWGDGRASWLEMRAFPVTDGLAVFWRDISERKRAEERIRESEEKYRSLFEAMDEAFAICELVRDAHGRAIDYRYVELNPALVRHVGISPETLEGRRASEVFGTVDPWLLETYIRVVDEGQSVITEHHFSHVDRWLRINVFPRGGDRFAALYSDVTERYRATEAIRESEERQAFLLHFTDAIRSERSEQPLIERAVQILAEELAVDRAYATKHDPAADLTNVIYEFHRPDLAPLPATLRFSDFPEAGRQTFEQTLVFEDTANDQTLTEADKVALASMDVGALLSRPLRRHGSPIFALGVVSVVPRRWTAAEIALVEEATERTWEAAERVRGEAALRKSEERFRHFADASAAGLWIRDAGTLNMEFISPAIERIYGVKAEDLIGDVKHWAALVVPDDRDRVIGNLAAAREGETVVDEFRIQRPSDKVFRWIRNTDFPLHDDGHVHRIGGIAEDVTEAKVAFEHQGVLLAELQHRVRNIMGMMRSMANRSAAGANSVADYRASLEGRLLALARVQALLTRQANASGSLHEIIDSEIAAQAHHTGQYRLTGPEIMLAPKMVEVLTLAFHELATNALKYGGLSVPDGRVLVRWEVLDRKGEPWLELDWQEQGAPPREPSSRRGFGSELIEMKVPYELRGKGKVSIENGRAHCRLEIPLRNAESILETDAPTPVTIHGGSLDMTDAPDLSGQKILVVEDDYYMASDLASALRGAGADVLGPCPSEDAALSLLESETPTSAVLDLNLGGGGPRFEIARKLKSRNIPFIFLTGYDPEAIPDDMHSVVRLQKPLPLREIIAAISALENRRS